jgi:hypothetical protein
LTGRRNVVTSVTSQTGIGASPGNGLIGQSLDRSSGTVTVDGAGGIGRIERRGVLACPDRLATGLDRCGRVKENLDIGVDMDAGAA